MGCKLSKNPRYKDSAVLASETLFSVNEVEALFVLYKELSGSIVKDGLIHKEELRKALLMNSGKSNLFVDRVFDLFDLKNNGVIEFGEFVRSLNVFHPNSPEADKIKFAFNLYDLRRTGYIEREEVKEMVLAILEEQGLTLSDDIIEVIIEKTFTDVDSNLDGKIDQEEWKEFVTRNPSLMKNMTLSYLKDVTTAFPSFLINSQLPDSELSVRRESQQPTQVNLSEVESLYELFRRLSSSIVDDGFIRKEEFQFGLFRIREKRSLLADRMFHLFDFKHDGLIDSGEFVRALSIFHPNAPQEEKIYFAFQLYDIWQTGSIQPEEVRELVLAFMDESDLILSDDIVQAITDKTFEEVDYEGDGKIDLEEWTAFAARNPSVLKCMTIPYLK